MYGIVQDKGQDGSGMRLASRVRWTGWVGKDEREDKDKEQDGTGMRLASMRDRMGLARTMNRMGQV
jgi:hypothetical protein